MPNSRRTGAIGMKCGMTTVSPFSPSSGVTFLLTLLTVRAQAWSANGTRVPITVIEIQDLQVSKIRVPMKDGVCALQLAGGWQKRKRMTTAEARNFETKGLAYKRYMREFPVTEDALLPVRPRPAHTRTLLPLTWLPLTWLGLRTPLAGSLICGFLSLAADLYSRPTAPFARIKALAGSGPRPVLGRVALRVCWSVERREQQKARLFAADRARTHHRQVGTTIGAGHFLPGQFVDVQAHTRGHGFQGAVRRFGFKGQSKTHGTTKTERSLGSMGGSAGSMFATRVFKGKRMAGRMGGKRRTVAGLMVWKVVPSLDLVFLKGSVPGAKVRAPEREHALDGGSRHRWCPMLGNTAQLTTPIALTPV